MKFSLMDRIKKKLQLQLLVCFSSVTVFAVAIFSFRKTNLMKVQTYNAAEVSGSVVWGGEGG